MEDLLDLHKMPADLVSALRNRGLTEAQAKDVAERVAFVNNRREAEIRLAFAEERH